MFYGNINSESLATVDFETPIVLTSNRIDEISSAISQSTLHFSTLSREIQLRLIEVHFRKTYLPPVDRKGNVTLRYATLRMLNQELVFIQAEKMLDSCATAYAQIKGRGSFEIHPNPKTVKSYVEMGIVFLERLDQKTKSRILVNPYLTSSGILQGHHAVLPHKFQLTASHDYVVLARITMMLKSLIRSDATFTGRVGYRISAATPIEWICSDENELSNALLLKHLPDNFRLTRDITIQSLNSEVKKSYRSFSAKLKQQSEANLLSSFFHITHLENVASIGEHGLYSLTKICSANLSHHDISDPEVQRWRDHIEPCYKRKIHDYVPLYINVRNPMLYVRRDLRDQLVILEVSKRVVDHYDCIFTDGNASSRDTLFSFLPEVLNDSIASLTQERWTDIADGKRRRCAELLVFPSIAEDFVSRVICFNEVSADEMPIYRQHR
jgi:hypothetical protein